MKLSVVKGATSVLVRIFIRDSSSTTGGGLTGLVFNTASLVCYRMRDDDGNAAATAITLATATRGTWTSGGFVEKDATNAPGWYEFGVPNAALATGSRSVSIHLKGATNMAPCPIEIELTGWDNADAVRGGMTALPNAAAAAAGGLWILGSNNTAAITLGALTVGAISGTTLTFSGAVAFQSTFAVTTSTSLGALSCTTLTASGAVAFQSTLAVTGTTTLTGVVTASNASNNIVGIDVAKISGDSGAADNAEAFFDGTGYAGTNNVIPVVTAVTGFTASDVGAIKAKTDNLPSDPADQSLIIDATNAIMGRLGAPVGASVSADVAAVKSDTAAIKAKTDSLTFTTAGFVDANVQYVNNVEVNGTGTGIDPWGP